MIKSFFNKYSVDYRENVSLKKYNTYKIEATCDYLVFPKTEEELIAIITELKKQKIKYLILGNGSNIILSMNHYEGAIIKLDYLSKIEHSDCRSRLFLNKVSR